MVEKQRSNRVRLDEVTLMRVISTLLIVLGHAFTCYNGSWEQPIGYIDISLYRWIARLSFAFALESFVFISGYLFGFQRITSNRYSRVQILIKTKLKRLIFPSIVFSLIYFIFFFEYKGLADMLYAILNGCGHLWFLPMLFWCFIFAWLLETIKVKDVWKMAFLLLVTVIPFFPIPFQIGSAASYLVYFYSGYLFYKHSKWVYSVVSLKSVLTCFFIFILIFVVFRSARDYLIVDESHTFLQKFFRYSFMNICHFLYAWTGIVVLYLVCIFITRSRRLSSITISLSACSFGIYIFHQFVLQLLYYRTSFPGIIGPYWLPWYGLLIALVVSYALSLILLRTRIGRLLIG